MISKQSCWAELKYLVTVPESLCVCSAVHCEEGRIRDWSDPFGWLKLEENVTGLLGLKVMSGFVFLSHVLMWSAGSCCCGRPRPWRPGRSARWACRNRARRRTWLKVRQCFLFDPATWFKWCLIVQEVCCFALDHSFWLWQTYGSLQLTIIFVVD